MRYFQTSNASRRYLAGGFAFVFESVANIGGSWLGVLAVGEPAASALAADMAAGKVPQITEITLADYEAQKKTPQSPPPNFRDYPGAPQSKEAPQLPLVGPAGKASPTSPPKAASPDPTPVKTQLKSARIEVPDELKLETGDRGKKK